MTSQAELEAPTVAVAAVGDIHVGEDSVLPDLDDVGERADLLLLAGDLTRCGESSEATRLAALLRDVAIPVVAVLGNHDHHAEQPDALVATLEDAGVTVLEQSATTVEIRGLTVGVAGAKGFAGGMADFGVSAFGEPEMKAFAAHGGVASDGVAAALAGLDTDVRLVLLHYSPILATLQGERAEILAFMGDYRLAEAIDAHGADLVLHGHAHHGRERGRTPGGIPVRNVAWPVIRSPYRVYDVPVGVGWSAAAAVGAGRRFSA